MSRREELNECLRKRNEELRKILIENYGVPSYDESLKLTATKDLFNMTLSQKMLYINCYDYLKKIAVDSDYEKNRITIFKRIDYTLTLIKLLSMFGAKIIYNYHLFFEARNIDNDNLSLEKVGDLIILLEAFNKIRVNDYSKYSALFFSRLFMNSVYPKKYVDSNEAIAIINHNLDSSIKRYNQDYNIYNDNNIKNLVKSIAADVNAKNFWHK